MRTAWNAPTLLKSCLVPVAACCTLLLAGCGGAENVAGTIISGGQKPIEVSPETFAAPVYCPALQLQSNTYLIMSYVRGKENQPEGLMYQATIEEWANDCTREGNDQTRIKFGLSGHVTSGPAWKGGQIDLPVRVAIIPATEDRKPLSSELLKVSVNVPAGAPRVAWTLVENKYVVPRDQEMKIVFGFDEGRRRR